MRRVFLLMGCFMGSIALTKAQQNYAVDKIPTVLTENAVAVIRSEDQFFDYKSTSSGRFDYKVAITILSKAGEDFAEMAEVYDKFSTLSNIKASIYDASGKKIKDYKSTDIMDRSLISDYSLFEDGRIKTLKFYHLTYPYTIEYSYSQDLKGVLSIPSWTDIKAYNVSTEKSTYSVQRPSNLQIHIRPNANTNTDSTKIGDKIKYTWSSANVSAIEREPLSIGFSSLCKRVQLSPSNFEYDGSSGNFDNWKNFGTWLHKLNEKGNELPANFKLTVQHLTKNAKTDQEKVSILYNYLQQNTRYVSVQLGIGGFKPILADKVAQVNYGDCKALSNFMKAMLNEAGVKANLIMIGNGMPSLIENFASIGQANHMIVCVPFKTDTTFLECTSQHSPMGFIGYNNADRRVLMITEDGGKIIKTPKYLAQDNYQLRKVKVVLDDLGKAQIAIKSSYANAQFEDTMPMMLMDAAAQKKTLVEAINIKGADLVSFQYKQPDKDKPLIEEDLNFVTEQLLSNGGGKSFLTLNLINQRDGVPPKIDHRKTYFSVNFSYQDTDEIEYILPKDQSIEFLPKDLLITSDFGTYEAKFTTKDNTITYVRKQQMREQSFAPERYNDYVEFLKKIYQADKAKAILTKKTS